MNLTFGIIYLITNLIFAGEALEESNFNRKIKKRSFLRLVVTGTTVRWLKNNNILKV